MPGRRRRRLPALLLGGGVTAALLLGAPAAVFALGGSGSAGTVAAVRATGAPAAPSPAGFSATTTATKRATALRGWGKAPSTARAGKRWVAHVRVSGGARIVRLERRSHGRWRLLDRVRADAKGAAVLDWRPRTATAKASLRIRVPATATHAALRTPARAVQVRRPVPVSPTPSPKPSASPAPSVKPSPSPKPSTSPSAAPSGDEAARARLLVLVNKARSSARSCGGTAYPAAKPLVRSGALDRAAGDYAARMATEHFFSHTAPDGSTMRSRIEAVGIRNVAMAENIAAGQRTAEAVMAAWLDSPGHCANVMSASVTRVGFGRADSSDAYRVYWVQNFAGGSGT